MALLTSRVPRLRHLRRAMRVPFGRRRRAQVWFNQQSVDLDATGTGQAFTVDAAGTASSGILTLTGNAVDAETVVIGTKTYTWETTLTNVDGNVLIGAAATDSIDNLIAAINLGTRQIAATGILTLTANAGDTETVTVGGVTYTFQTTLTDTANNVLIGAAATDSIDNLIAAITAGAGVGTLYGTGTVVNPDATAAAGAGDTMDVTATTLGLAGNSVATTETMATGSFANATLLGGSDLYAASMAVSTDVSAAAGAGDTMDLTALIVGVIGDLIATTETMTAGSFGAVTLEGGVEADRVAITAHGYTSGDGPFVLTNSGGALPAGLLVDTPYWPGVLGANDFKVYLTQDQALRDVAPVDITGAGTGTHTITPSTASIDLVEKVRQGDVSTDRLNTLTDIDDIT